MVIYVEFFSQCRQTHLPFEDDRALFRTNAARRAVDNMVLNRMGHGQLVRTDKLSLLRVGIVARHGSLRSILAFLGVGIVLKRFARAD